VRLVSCRPALALVARVVDLVLGGFGLVTGLTRVGDGVAAGPLEPRYGMALTVLGRLALADRICGQSSGLWTTGLVRPATVGARR
jgi:hypothetical protein